MDLMHKLGKTFTITTELGPVKGAMAEEAIEKAQTYLPLDGINIHDCPMANLRINTVSMGALIQNRLAVAAVPHLTCRDRSLLGTQADLLGAHALGIRHILATTGDPPKHGPYPSKAVYDYNTYELVRLIKKMNRGVDYNDKDFGGQTDFKVACTATPTATDMDREISRMERKIQAGADFFQTQVVYDVEKAITFANKAKPLGKPILFGIMPLKSVKMARYMQQKVSGIDVSESIIQRMEDGGVSGIDIVCEIVEEIKPYADGIHIMALGDISGTNKIVEFVRALE
jgi:homocysteine S-methyltransferase